MKVGTMARAIVLCFILAPAASVKDFNSYEVIHFRQKKSERNPGHSDTLDEMASMDPQLPAVATMVSTASDTMKDITAQAAALQARVVQIQTENEASLAKQRAIFEHQLKQQERSNRAINNTNSKTSVEIATLISGNFALEKHGAELTKSNERILSEIKTLEAKVGTSKEFLVATLTSSDDSNTKPPVVPSLQVQEVANEAVSKNNEPLDHHRNAEKESSDDSEDDADDADNTATSFLALKSRSDEPAANVEDLVSTLSKRVTSFASQAKDSHAKLQAAYLSDFNAGESRKSVLLEEQKKLNATRKSLFAEEAQLQASDDKLQNTKRTFQQRLRGFGLFLQRLAHVALAPDNMAPQLLQDLPESIAVPATGPATSTSN